MKDLRTLIAGALIGATLASGMASASTSHARHENIENLVCERPTHFYREHGISIMPESCE